MDKVYFKEQLQKQLMFLKNSCDLYDSGSKEEAVRIATSLRVMFYDPNYPNPKSKSLLKHLCNKNFRLLSTCEIIPRDAKFWCNLTNMTINPTEQYADYYPKLDSARTKKIVKFERWWEEQTVYLNVHENLRINRKDLVLAAANKDGGAHVDEKLDERYERILEGAGWSMTVNPPDGSGPIGVQFKYGHLAALRQMGYEVLNSEDIQRLASNIN